MSKMPADMYRLLPLALIAPVLAACGSSLAAPAAGTSLAPNVVRQVSRAAPAARSWMNRRASQGALLYVSDNKADAVYVYTYPGNALVGTLVNLGHPEGECIDAAGDVYIVDGVEYGKVFEFAHGGTSPIATFDIPREFVPASCSISPITGELAVADPDFATGKETFAGDVYVYRSARAKPTKYRVSNLQFYYFLAYDGAGNLFVDGSAGRPVQFAYAELPSQRRQMTPITLSGGSIAYPGNVQWDGTHITVGDQDNAVIYQTQGSRIVGSTPLKGSSDVLGYFIEGGTVICPDAGNGSVEFYNYPAGGMPTAKLTGFETPFGAVVSP
jgi:hypothetical protein